MTTLDQLSPDRRAIIELILGRGQSYADLSGALGMPESRVREHAREALASLAPRTAERVDAQWRAQVADYVLGQQSGPQAKATRSHLRSSEPARAWALSVLDSVGHLYPGGAEPAIPAGRGDGGERARGQAAPAPVTAAAPEGRADTADGRGAAPARAPRLRRASSSSAGGGSMSPEARAHVRRRRIATAVGAAIVVLAAILLATQLFGGDDEGTDDAASTDTAASTEPELLYRIPLQPVGDTRGSGAAAIFNQQGQTAMLAQARLPEPQGGQTYGVWLFNDPDDAEAVPTQTDPRGAVQAFGPLPPDFEQYSFVDVSLEDAGRGNQTHSGDSVLRGPLAGAEATGDEVLPGGTELPAPEAPPAPPEGG